ncbi:MAG TPA: hypothetical protein VIS06_11395 [Mycobacteriales bacterium]
MTTSTSPLPVGKDHATAESRPPIHKPTLVVASNSPTVVAATSASAAENRRATAFVDPQVLLDEGRGQIPR